MKDKTKEALAFGWRTASVHMVSYFLAGIFALLFMNYKELFKADSFALLMKPVESPVVALGPALQIIQGLVLSLFLYPFRSVFLSSKRGWALLLLLIAGFSIFAPEIPGPGTFEGLVYTKIPLVYHLLSLPETLVYSLLFSGLLFLWYKKPKKAWNVISIIAVCLIFLMSALGYLSSVGILKA